MIAQTFTETLTLQPAPGLPAGPVGLFGAALSPYWLIRARERHPLRAQGRFNRPMPGVAETQCYHCGALSSGPRRGWIPAAYDLRGQLTPVAIGVRFTTLRCEFCKDTLRRLRRLGAHFRVIASDSADTTYSPEPEPPQPPEPPEPRSFASRSAAAKRGWLTQKRKQQSPQLPQQGVRHHAR